MVRYDEPASEREFLWLLAYSESDSESRHGDRWREALGHELTRTIADGRPERLSEPDWERLRHAFELARGEYLRPLLALRPAWRRARIGLEEIGDLRVIARGPFSRLAPNRTLREFVQGLDNGEDTAPDRFAARYRRLRPRFVWARARGSAVLAATGPEGPFLEIDGLTRLSLAWSLRDSAAELPRVLSVLVALTPRLPEWSAY